MDPGHLPIGSPGFLGLPGLGVLGLVLQRDEGDPAVVDVLGDTMQLLKGVAGALDQEPVVVVRIGQRRLPRERGPEAFPPGASPFGDGLALPSSHR